MSRQFRACVLFLTAGLCFLGGQAQADTVAKELRIKKIRLLSETAVYIGTSPQPQSTCSLFGEHVRLDTSTAHGKNLLAALLAAHMGNHSVDLWFTASTAPGSNEDSGCDDTTVAVLNQVRVR